MSKSNPEISCPKCHKTILKVVKSPRSLEDLYGASCANCGTVITEEEVKRQALEIAAKAARDAFSKAGLSIEG